MVASKAALVVELGSSLVRCGFAGEEAPRFALPSPRRPLNEADWALVIDPFVAELLASKLLVRWPASSTDRRRVVVLESPTTPAALRSAWVAAFANCVGSQASFVFIPSLVAASQAVAGETMLLLDVGHAETRCVAVVDGRILLHTLCLSSRGARDVTARLGQYIKEQTISTPPLVDDDDETVATLSHDEIDKMTVAMLKVELTERSLDLKGLKAVLKQRLLDALAAEEEQEQQQKQEDAPATTTSTVVLLQDAELVEAVAQACYVRGRGDAARGDVELSSRIVVPAEARHMACDALFEDEESIPELVRQCLLKAPVDARRPLAERIIPHGGGVMLPGFNKRLLQELRSTTNLTFKLPSLAFSRSDLAWIGASALTSARPAEDLIGLSFAQLQEQGIPDILSVASSAADLPIFAKKQGQR